MVPDMSYSKNKKWKLERRNRKLARELKMSYRLPFIVGTVTMNDDFRTGQLETRQGSQPAEQESVEFEESRRLNDDC